MKIKMLAILFLFLGQQLSSQDSDLQKLEFYGDAMMNAEHSVNRQYAFDEFYPLFKKVLNSTAIIDESTAEITGLRSLIPEDKSFILYSWQLETDKESQYYAFLKTKEGKVFEFDHNNTDFDLDFPYYIHSPTDWYGAIYYKIREEIRKNEKQYIITGFKRLDKFTKVKIVEVLSFDKEGNVSLGKEIFHKPIEGARDDVFAKLVMTYDANAFVEYTYDEETKRIVYDHLVSRRSKVPGQGMTKYPDGTYEGYDNKKGTYKYVEMVRK